MEPHVRVAIVAGRGASAVLFDVVTWDASLHPQVADVGGAPVESVNHPGAGVQGSVAPEEDNVGPQVRAAELLPSHVTHHRLDGDGVGQAVRAEAVSPTEVGVGELRQGVLLALAGVEVEIDVPILVHQRPRSQPLGLDEGPMRSSSLAATGAWLVVSGGQTRTHGPLGSTLRDMHAGHASEVAGVRPVALGSGVGERACYGVGPEGPTADPPGLESRRHLHEVPQRALALGAGGSGTGRRVLS